MNVGGGPGFDAVGLQLLASFLGAEIQFDHLVVDIEPRWAGSIDALHLVLRDQAAVHTSTKMSFAEADLTAPDLFAKDRTIAFGDVHLFIFAYVCVENGDSLRSTEFEHLQRFFEAASVGCIFAFLDSSDRLWPDIRDAARRVAPFQASFVYVCGKVRMFLQRMNTAQESIEDRGTELLNICHDHAACFGGRKEERMRLGRDNGYAT